MVVVNLAEDQKAGAKRAAELRKSLKTHVILEPIQDGPSAVALERPLPEAAAVVAEGEARAALVSAEAEMANYRYKRALSRIAVGERQTRTIPPSDKQRALLSQLAFLRGLGELGEQNRGKAREAFELAIRLDADREGPNPAAFDPVVVSLWKAAVKRTSAEATTKLAINPVNPKADVYVNGKKIGQGLVVAELVPGDHEIAATLPGFAVAARRVVVGEGELTETLRLVRLQPAERAIALRRRLLGRADLTHAELSRATAELVRDEGADGAFVIRGGETLEVAALRPDDGLLTWFRPAEGAESLFGIYVRVDIDLRLTPPIEPVDQPWWRSTPVTGFLGGIGAAGVVAFLVVVLNNSSPTPRTATCCDTESLRLRWR